MKQLAKALLSLPYFVNQWRKTLAAVDLGEWDRVDSLLAEMHSRKLATDDSHFLRACALLQLERWGDAISELDLIESELDDKGDEASRWMNKAIALNRLGRSDDAVALVTSKLSPDWPPEEREKAETLISSLS